MANYGRNFEFRVQPDPNHRAGRYVIGATRIPIGTPIVSTAVEDAQGRLVTALLTGSTKPVTGINGILVYEYAWAAYAGFDPDLTTPSDLDFAPSHAAVQLVSGDEVKVLFRNTEEHLFFGGRVYPGRIMIGGLGATPTLDVGDFVGPGVGNDNDGYWAPEADPDKAWFTVTHVNSAGTEVECRMLF